MNDTRQDKLEESIIPFGQPYKFYSVGRTNILKRLGNPFFGGEPEDPTQWDMDRKLGVAWVIFTRESAEIEKIISGENPLREIDRIWSEEMHYRELERIYTWVMEQVGLTEAARTEAAPEKGGKSEEESAETPHAG